MTPPTFSLDNIPAAISDDGLVIAGQSTLNDELNTIVAVRWLCS